MPRGLLAVLGAVAIAAAPLQGALADDMAPHVVIERPTERSVLIPMPQANPAEPLQPIVIEGAAGDDVSVYAITLRLYDTIGRSSTLATECSGCGSQVAVWSARMFLPPGSYVVEATAVDSSGYSRTSPRRSFYVL